MKLPYHEYLSQKRQQLGQRSPKLAQKLGSAASLIGPTFTASMVLGSAISAEGGPGNKFKAGARSLSEMAGFEVATSFAGKGIAAAARTKAGRFALGKHASKVGKWGRLSRGNLVVLGTALAAEGAYEFQKHLADIGSQQRMTGLEWGKGSPGMDTRRAYTMRQQSLQMMNRGSMSARSLLGREAQYLHQ